MAENKKSFIAYTNWKDTFDALTNEKAGELIKHIFAYVSDEDPQTEDMLINAVFANIKNTLKRDLGKWDTQHQQRVDAGKRSAEIRKRNATTVERPLNDCSVSSTVNDNVNVSVNENDNVNEIEIKEEKFVFRKELLKICNNKEVVKTFLEIRKKKKSTNSEIAFNSLKAEFEKTNKTPEECLTICCEKSWAGFKAEWVGVTKTDNPRHHTNTTETYTNDL